MLQKALATANITGGMIQKTYLPFIDYLKKRQILRANGTDRQATKAGDAAYTTIIIKVHIYRLIIIA